MIWRALSDNQRAENVFYLSDSSDAIFTNPGSTVAAIQTALVARLVPATDPQVEYNSLIFEDVRTVPFGGVEFPQTARVGTAPVGGQTMPSNCCKAIKKSTGVLGRSGRGRWFFPCLSKDVYATGDTLQGSHLIRMTTGLNNFQVDIEAALAPAQVGIVSYRHAGAPRVAGVFEHIISWGAATNEIDTQRRRLLGHNRHR